MGLLNIAQVSENSDSNEPTDWNDFVEELKKMSVVQKAYGREISINGNLGEFNIRGQIDFAIIFWEKDEPKLRLVECKASRKDRTYHQVQVAVYQMIVRQLIKDNPVIINKVELTPENIECVVVRIDENTNKSQDIFNLKL